MIQKLLIILFLLPFSGLLGQAPLITDRPDQTESSALVPVGAWQIESGFSLEKTDLDGPVSVTLNEYEILSTLLRIGIHPSFELRVGSGYLKSEFDPESDLGKSSFDGLDVLQLGVKYQLFGTPEGREAAVILSTDLPVGEDQLTGDNIGGSAIAIYAHPLGNRFGVGYNIGYEYSSGAEQKLKYSIAVGAELSERLGGFVEIFGEAIQDNLPAVRADGGLTFSILNNFQLDLFAGIPLNDYAPDLLLGTGISLRLPQ